MMRTILLPLAPGLSSEPALDVALLLAKRMNSHIRAVFVRPDPALALSYFPAAMATATTYQLIESEGRKAEEEEKIRFEAWRSRHGIPAEPADTRLDTCFASWSEQMGEIEPVVIRRGRVSDLIVMQRFAPDNILAQRCFDAALFGSGRPTLLVPGNPPGDLLDHVLIAGTAASKPAMRSSAHCRCCMRRAGCRSSACRNRKMTAPPAPNWSRRCPGRASPCIRR